VGNILKKGGKGLHVFFFVIFVILTFFAKQNMLNNQVEGEIIE
jgi:preprotein translocase subunit SecG